MDTARNLSEALTKDMQTSLAPASIIQELKDGNARFLAGESEERDFLAQVKSTAGARTPWRPSSVV